MDLLKRIALTAARDPTRVAYVDPGSGQSLTYAALHEQIERRSPSDQRVILLQSANTLDLPGAFLAAIAAGVDVLMLNESSTAAEVDALAERIVAAAESVGLSNGDGALLLATSGSTGIPKIVRRTAASLDAVAANMVEAIGFTPEDRVLAAVPLTHSYGVEHGLLAPLWAGATVVLCAGLDLPSLATAFAQGVTIFPAVPSMIERLAATHVAGIDRCRRIYSAGGALPAATRARFESGYGRPVGQLFGSTEVGTVLYRAEPGEEGDVGWPMADVSVRILNPDDRTVAAAPGDPGEVAIRSPSMFEAYVGDEPSELIDGHFLTGDLGNLTPDRSLRLGGRSRLLIDTGGLKVNPTEVERVLSEHPDVAACVVVALRQSETVSRLRAIIVPRDPDAPPDVDAIRTFARSRLAPYKVPRAIEFRRELPRSATGKILRHIVEAS